jgi:hypothetical protein
MCDNFSLPPSDPRQPTHLYYPSTQNGGRAGRFIVPDDRLEEVYTKYISNDNDEKLFLIEQGSAPYPFVCDLDLKDGDPETPTLYAIATADSNSFWDRIHTILLEVCESVFEIDEAPDFHLLGRANSQCYHIHIPPNQKFFMDHKRAMLFRDVALDEFRKDTEIASMSLVEIPEREWDKFYDKSIYKAPAGKGEYVTLRALGSYSTKDKKIASGPYLPADGVIT